jgi:transposase InsO family protein
MASSVGSKGDGDGQRGKQQGPQTGTGPPPTPLSLNGPQFIAGDFQEFIRPCGMPHAPTAPYYPQSNGTIERWHGIRKEECLRPGAPLTPEGARRLGGRFVEHYNTIRLHSAIG